MASDSPTFGQTKYPKTGAEVSCRSYLKRIQEQLKGKLDLMNLTMLNQSCFWPLVAMYPIKFHGQLVYHMMLHLEDGLHNGSLKFKMNGREFFFGRKEFFLLTGLRFGPPKELPTHSTIHEETFGGRRPLTFEAFKFEEFCPQEKNPTNNLIDAVEMTAHRTEIVMTHPITPVARIVGVIDTTLPISANIRSKRLSSSSSQTLSQSGITGR